MKRRLPTVRGWHVALLGSLLTVIVLLNGALWCRNRNFDALERGIAMQIAGSAGLDYWREMGHCPESVSELLEEGFLTGDGRYVGPTRRRGGAALLDYVQQVELSFPATSDECEIIDGKVVKRGSGDELAVVHLDGAHGDDYVRVNRELALEWFQLAQEQKNDEQTGP